MYVTVLHEIRPMTSLHVGENQSNKVDVPEPSEPSGFRRGLVAEEILGATEMDGQILFLIKW